MRAGNIARIEGSYTFKVGDKPACESSINALYIQQARVHCSDTRRRLAGGFQQAQVPIATLRHLAGGFQQVWVTYY